jgi:uncharacterized membrane protein YgdD (TMEM256/DUF423 family)
MSNIWLQIAGVSGASAVALGAIGAHAMAKLPEAYKDTWKVSSHQRFAQTLIQQSS